jgi:hypothetical protein
LDRDGGRRCRHSAYRELSRSTGVIVFAERKLFHRPE